MKQALFAVTVNWNLKNQTVKCIESLVAAGLELKHVIVVDNGSVDHSLPAFRERFGESLGLIDAGKNLGYAGGCNLGIKYALEQKADWVLILNNDTHISPTFFAALDDLQPDQGFGILGPVIYFENQPRIWYSGDRFIPGLLLTRPVHKELAKFSHRALQVDFISGCCMLIRRNVFEKIGLFDESFFMYGEDVDFCWRAQRNGIGLAVAPDAVMWHQVASSERDHPGSRYFRVRNQIQVYRRYGRRGQLALTIFLTWIRLLGIALTDLGSGRSSLIKPTMKGWADGWFQ